MSMVLWGTRTNGQFMGAQLIRRAAFTAGIHRLAAARTVFPLGTSRPIGVRLGVDHADSFC
jgi:hypothetical protein